MAFVYCDDRWKDYKENNFPGPCQYTVPEAPVTQSSPHIPSRLIKSMKNKRSERLNQPTFQKTFQKDEIDRKMIEVNQNHSQTLSKINAKKGKIYRNRSVELKSSPQNEFQHKTELKMLIKNAFHSHSQAASRNKWGNMRIKQMLNQHHANQISKNAGKILVKQNRNILLPSNGSKVKEELKDIQNIFTTHRKGYNANMQHFNKCKSPTRNIISRAISQNQLRLSDNSLKEFQIEPAIVYQSEKFDQQFIKNNITHSTPTPTCSIGSSKIAIREKSVPTGLEEDTFDEDSMQYISDATPGPGSYDLHTQTSKISTKIEKFGVTMQRFKPQKKVSPTFVVPKTPQYKVSTNAKQEDVGFGRSTKEQEQKINLVHNGTFYQDCNTLQYKSKKTLLKKKGEKVCFDSGKERFGREPPKDILQSSQGQDITIQEQDQFEQCKPTCIFMSKVNRQLVLNTNTEDVQFSGQNTYCIANKLKKQKQYYEDYDLKPPPFLTNSKRFIYDQAKDEQKKEVLLGIKIQELKKNKKQVKKKSIQKGYAFPKQIKHDGSLDKSQQMPSPDRYQKSTPWVKHSYNIRFN